jgi:putative heme iron utilization protein
MSTRSERAEAVRTLIREARHGLLSTNGLEPAGFPYGSLVPVASAADGRPVLLISHLAQHTKNLVADGRASLLVAAKTGGDPQQAARASVLGNARRLEGAAEAEAKARFLEVHPEAARYFDLAFQLWAIAPVEARYVGGFGAAAWVSGSELTGA